MSLRNASLLIATLGFSILASAADKIPLTPIASTKDQCESSINALAGTLGADDKSVGNEWSDCQVNFTKNPPKIKTHGGGEMNGISPEQIKKMDKVTFYQSWGGTSMTINGRTYNSRTASLKLPVIGQGEVVWGKDEYSLGSGFVPSLYKRDLKNQACAQGTGAYHFNSRSGVDGSREELSLVFGTLKADDPKEAKPAFVVLGTAFDGQVEFSMICTTRRPLFQDKN